MSKVKRVTSFKVRGLAGRGVSSPKAEKIVNKSLDVEANKATLGVYGEGKKVSYTLKLHNAISLGLISLNPSRNKVIKNKGKDGDTRNANVYGFDYQKDGMVVKLADGRMAYAVIPVYAGIISNATLTATGFRMKLTADNKIALVSDLLPTTNEDELRNLTKQEAVKIRFLMDKLEGLHEVSYHSFKNLEGKDEDCYLPLVLQDNSGATISQFEVYLLTACSEKMFNAVPNYKIGTNEVVETVEETKEVEEVVTLDETDNF